MELTRSLENVCQHDGEIAGGKAARLGELIHAGLPVPPGFVLLTSAYRLFVATNNLQEEIERLAHGIKLTEPASVEQASASIRALFEQGAMPAEITTAVSVAYGYMKNKPVAVRSSATAEDLPTASFAGQQESYLNVRTDEEVLAAIRRCWSSLWTARALDYRAHQGIDAASISLAVVVQEMVDAEVSGVLFTLNPVTGDRDEVVVDATWGLGEALVAGQVTPDAMSIHKQTGIVKQLRIGDKAMMTVPVEHGTMEQPVASALREKAALTIEQIGELVALGRQIEAHFGTAQDIEWAIADGHIAILQSRPITTQPTRIPPGDDNWDREGDLPPQPFDIWTRTNVGENLPFPITPLTATNFPRIFALDAVQQPAPTFQATKRFYGRLYINEGAIVHEMTERFGMPSSLLDKLWGSRARARQQEKARFHPLRFTRNLPAMFRGISAANPKGVKGPKHTPQQFFAQIDAWVASALQQDLQALDDRALWQLGLPLWRERGAYAWNTNLRISTPSALLYGALERIVKWFTGRSELTQDLVTGLPGIYSAEIGPALWQMAQTLREQGLDSVVRENAPATALTLLRQRTEAQPFFAQLDHFLQRHGHRCPNELELLNPRWVEAPEQVIELLANYLQAGEESNPLAIEQRQQERRTKAVATVEQHVDPLRRTIFRAALKRAQQAIITRDNSRNAMTKFIFPMRMLYAQLGQRWAKKGWLQQPEDIFFLTVPELAAIAENGLSFTPAALQERIANRRTAYAYWLSIVPADALGSDGQPLIEDITDATLLTGTPASSGRVRGRARLIQDVHAAMRLTKDDILVTQATDPGWTPVFPLVGGVVLEIGGQLSHGAIVAREYAIPAVVNVQGAMRHIQDGQMIVVDGTNGRVYLDETTLN